MIGLNLGRFETIGSGLGGRAIISKSYQNLIPVCNRPPALDEIVFQIHRSGSILHGVRVLEALKILEVATVECKLRSIETPEVREALDLLDPYCRPTWYVDEFRSHLAPCHDFGPSLEGQQQNLRVNFGGIYRNVRRLLAAQVGRLRFRYSKTKDPAFEAELDRLTDELAKLPERWEFSARRAIP
jgi:hypothetical protein